MTAPEVEEVRWVRQLGRWLAPHRINVAIALGAALAGTGVAGLTPLIQKIVVDDVTERTGDAIAPWLMLLAVAGLARFGLAYVRRYSGGRVAVDVQYDLRTALFRHVQRLDVASHDQLQTGQLVARAGTDVNALHHLLSLLPIVLGNVLLFVIALVVMLSLSPLLTLVVFAVVPVMAVATARVRKTIFPASWEASQQSGVVAGIVDESVTGVRVVKGFGQERRELGRLADAAADLLASRTRLVRLQARFAPTLQVIPILAQVAVLASGGWLTIRGRITLGTFLAFNVYVSQLVGPVRTGAFLFAFSQQAKASIQRLAEVLDANPAVTDKPDAIVLTDNSDWGLEIDDVTFGYVPSEPVLNHFSLRVAQGETVALVGTSGSGKSTVALLVPRFYDVHGGTVRVGGNDVRDVTLGSLRAQIGVVFEDPFLFSDTLRSNIAYGRPEATDAEVEAAARAAEAHEFITSLPLGYDTVVGEQGLTLSGGQRQRVALARALITDPQVLILDDATSAVDSQVEQEILATLRRLLVGRTTVLVAHRRSTLRLADRIAVVDQGRVVALGTAAELEAQSPLYRALLSGPDDDVETVGEAETPASDPGTASWDGLPTPGLWVERQVTAAEALAAAGRLPKPSPGSGHRGGPGHGGGAPTRGAGNHMGASMVATPELLAAVAALPPATDRPDVSVEDLDTVEPSFSFWHFLRRWRRLLALGMTLVVVDSATNLLGPSVIRFGVDRGVEPGRTDLLWLATAMALVVALASWGNAVAEQLVTGATAEKVLYALRVRVFAHLQRLSLNYYDREMGGRVMTRMTTDVDAMQQLLATGLVQAIVSGVTCGGVAIALVAMSPQLALVTAAIVPPLALATWLYRQRAYLAYDRARDRVAEVNADFQESLSGVRVAQAYSREGRNEERFAGLADSYRQARVDAQRLVALYFPFVEMLSELANALVLGAGAVFVVRGKATTGELIAFLLYLSLFFAPIQQLSQVFDTWQQARISITRIQGLLALPSGTPESLDAVNPGRPTGRIELADVRFRYAQASDEALRGLDLVIEPGETVAFVGETGAGKSTVLKMVARYYDVTGGAVLIDGVDIRQLDLTAFRQQLGVVPQEPFLFAGTIRDNIAYGRPDATNATVEAAARAVGAHDLIASLPGGYTHIVGERGRSLSAGQRQLIALARALLPDPPILLLDEATANLDLATEARVTEGMGVAARGRTTLLIAHRLTTATTADRIVVMDAGQIVEIGSHEDLLSRGGAYTRMWKAFAGAEA